MLAIPRWIRSFARSTQLLVAVLLDLVLVGIVAPELLRWGLLSLMGGADFCSGVGCEGPLMVVWLFITPALSLALAIAYVVLSVKRGRSPFMTMLGVPGRSRRPSGLAGYAMAR